LVTLEQPLREGAGDLGFAPRLDEEVEVLWVNLLMLPDKHQVPDRTRQPATTWTYHERCDTNEVPSLASDEDDEPVIPAENPPPRSHPGVRKK